LREQLLSATTAAVQVHLDTQAQHHDHAQHHHTGLGEVLRVAADAGHAQEVEFVQQADAELFRFVAVQSAVHQRAGTCQKDID